MRLPAVAAIALLFSSCGYNQMVNHQEEVNKAWSQMENLCESRMDKTSQLLDTYEKDDVQNKKLLGVIRHAYDSARLVLTSISPAHLGQKKVSEFEDSQDTMTDAVHEYFDRARKEGRAGAGTELKNLADSFEALDKKINDAMLNYNAAALRYNASRKRIAHIAMALLAPFHTRGYFMKVTGKS